MFADRVNERGRKRRGTLCNRVRGDGDLGLSLFLWLAGDCSGKWPSNVTTNGHCCRTEGGGTPVEKGEGSTKDGGVTQPRFRKEARRQCSGSGASFFFLRESACGTGYRADRIYNPKLRGTHHGTNPMPVARSSVDLGQ